jgi:hypothetical protein
MWSLIKNKIPIWDRMKLGNMEGLGWCTLCKADEEIIPHLFLHCLFVKLIWTKSSYALSQVCVCQGHIIEEAWRNWITSPTNRNIKALHLLIN